MVHSEEYGRDFDTLDLKCALGFFRLATKRYNIEGHVPEVAIIDDVPEFLDEVIGIAEQVGFYPMGGRIDRIMEEKVLGVKRDAPRVFTSYWSNLGILEKYDVLPISIARFPPRGIKGDRYGKMTVLAPSPEMLAKVKAKQIDGREFDSMYDTILNKLDAAALLAEALKLGAGRDVALMCFEAPSDRCHRHQAAAWFNDELKLVGDKAVVEFPYKG